MPLVGSKSELETPLVREPAYSQLNERLRRLATSGSIPAGGRFPTERELAARFGVSRVTANKAVSQLVMEGLLQSRTGVGTFVRDDGFELDLGSLMSFTRLAKLSGRVPSTRVLEFRRVRAESLAPEIREGLKLPAEEDVFVIGRLRLADGIPVILEHRHLRASACPELSREDLAGSLYDRLQQEPETLLKGSEQTIRAKNLDLGEARMLEVPPGSAALWIHAVGQSEKGALWVEDTLYRGDQYGFHNSLALGRGGKPARISQIPFQDTPTPPPIP